MAGPLTDTPAQKDVMPLALITQSSPEKASLSSPHSGGLVSPQLASSPLATDPEAATAGPQVLSSQRLAGWRLAVVQVCLCIGLFLSVLETSIVATALVTIGDEFGDFIKTTWIVLGYLLSYMGFAIIFARFSDALGRKWALLYAWIIFSAFSLACGFSQSLNQLIAFRTLQGLGGSGLYTMTMVVMPEISPPHLFTLLMSCVACVFALSSVLGPVLGGVITKTSTWRWIFWLNCPPGAAVIIAILTCWPGASRSLVVKQTTLLGIDYLGSVLLLGASVLLVFGLQEGGAAAWPWDSSAIIATLTMAGVLLIVFIAWVAFLEHRRNLNNGKGMSPIFPFALVQRRRVLIAIVSTFLTGFPFILVIIMLPERFQVVNLETPIMAGVHMLPMLCASAAGAGTGGIVSTKKNNTFWTLLAGSCFTLLGCGLLSTASHDFAIQNRQYGYQVLFGFGIGMTFSTVTIMTALEAKFSDLAVAQGAVNQVRVLGGAIGLAAGTIIFNTLARQNLEGVLTPEALITLQQSPESAYSLPLSQQLAVREVFAESFNKQLRVCTYIAIFPVIFAVLAYTRNPPDVLERKALHDAVLDGRAEAE